MKHCFFVIACFLCLLAYAQTGSKQAVGKEKFFSFDPLGLAEPAMAIGTGFGYRFTKRSEAFTGLSYLGLNPFYKDLQSSLNGFRFISQYRYHVLSPWYPFKKRNPFALGNKRKNWIALEFRLKMYSFSDVNHFVNGATKDTIQNFLYKAQATVFGSAVLFGNTYNLGSNGKWALEFSIGIGAKQKSVRFKNVPVGYDVQKIETIEWGIVPKIYESVGTPYIPCALRVRYRIS